MRDETRRVIRCDLVWDQEVPGSNPGAPIELSPLPAFTITKRSATAN